MPRTSNPHAVAPIHIHLTRAAALALALAAALAAPHESAAQGAPLTRSAADARSAAITDVSYEVTIDSTTTAARSMAVAMHFRVTEAGPVVLALPAWTPGHYTMLWFARRVSRFSPMIEGRPLPWHQLDFQTWRLDGTAPGARVTVAFDYLADTIDRAVAWTRPDFAFFNGTNVFMYPVGHGFTWPARVIVHAPQGWRVATGMTALPMRTTSGAGAMMHHDYDVEHPFSAGNYHDLVDMPFFVGHFDLDSVAVRPAPGAPEDHWVRLAAYPAGSDTGARRARILGWLAKLAETHARVFRDMPWKTYTVLQIADPNPNTGGLEHQDSQLDEIPSAALDSPLLPGLYAHEMFHSWNVKRLRPADLVPYRYDQPQPTGWLWVSEGVTDYYGALGVVRSGIGDSTGFFAKIAGDLTATAAAPPTALPDASLRPWIDPTDGSDGLYYPKGSAAGFLTDILIRDASNDRHSLDDVMRSLYDSTYKRGRGFTPTDWWSAVARASAPGTARIPWSVVRGRYVDGRDPFPWDTVLPLAGLRLVTDTTHVVQLGIATSPDSAAGGLRVVYLAPGGPAAQAGMAEGDLITQLGDVTIRDDASLEQFQHKYAGANGTTVPARVVHSQPGTSPATSAGPAVTLQLPIRTRFERTIRIEPDPAAPAKAARIRHAILTGTTE